MKRICYVVAFAAVLTGCQTTVLNNESAIAEKYAKASKVDVLSTHQTISRLKDVKFHTCRGMTALCPDRCGDSGEFASFEILEYKNYAKNGEYGDGKQSEFRVQLTDFNKKPLKNSVAKYVSKLEVGDRVELDWNHLYVDQNGSKFPVREVVRIIKLD